MSMYDDKHLASFREDLLSEHARAQHRNLVLIASAAIVAAVLNLKPTRISALGVDFQDTAGRRTILIGLIVAVLYFGLAFIASAAADFGLWAETRRDARGFASRFPAELERFREEEASAREALKVDPQGNTTAARDHEDKLNNLQVLGRRKTLYDRLFPANALRALLDFGVPLVAGCVALALLVWRLT